MNARKISMALLFSALTLVSGFAAPADAISSMTALDKKYIPALGLSGQAGQLEKAKLAFAVFEVALKDFDLRFSRQPGFDAEWNEDLAKVGEAVSKAKSALFDESNGPKAHEALEAVRMTLLASRTRQGLPYFLDYLTIFHNSMEDLLNDKPAKPSKEWSENEKMSFAADLDVAIALWKKVKSKEGYLQDAALSAKASAAYQAQWLAIDGILAGTKRSYEAGDEKGFAEKLGQLKPAFIKTFFLFGDFPQ